MILLSLSDFHHTSSYIHVHVRTRCVAYIHLYNLTMISFKFYLPVTFSTSSSSTVMTYAANNLFIGSLSTSRIYTVASDLANVGEGQLLALGVVQLNYQSVEELRYRDMIIVSESLQILPGKLHYKLFVNEILFVYCCVDTLQQTDRRKDKLTPIIARASPPRLSDSSTASETVVEWDQSSLPTPIQNTPVYYVLEYQISSEVQQNITVS